MKRIPLTQGKFALVDDEDYERLLKISGKWCAGKFRTAWYALGHVRGSPRGKCVRMHRVLMNAKPGQWIDHKNRNGLDNRRCNIRFASREQNGWNRGTLRNNTSGFKGANKHYSGRWLSRITVNRERIFLGLFDSAKEAGAAYAMAAKKYHGEFARVR